MKYESTILLVDDDSESLALLAGILTAEGYQVRSANSGQLALTSVSTWLPHLILLDIHMPGMDGFAVCRELKASGRTSDIPLVFLSAARDTDEQVAGLALGAVDYITKPFRREELLARVKTHLELGRLRADLGRQVAERTSELDATIHRLRESEERFRNMADTAPVMIWVSGPDKLCTFFNQGWLTFTGTTMEQAVGNGWLEMIYPDDRDPCYESYVSAFDAHRTYRTECRLRGADGEYRWVLVTGTPRYETDGVFVGFIGTLLDISELKRGHEEDLTRQRMETVGELARGIAHDFNNLLGGVLAYSELALGELDRGLKPADELRRIRDAANRGAEIVRQLMVYSGEETEKVELVNISELVQDMLELLSVSVSKRVRVETDFGGQLRVVRASPSRLRQIIMNLFSNASEAIGDKDGVIRVATAQVAVGAGAVAAISGPIAEGEYVQLEVSDTGRGMTPEVQARIFNPFFTTKSTGSHGHGLVVVKRIVEHLNGAIRISSEPGRGTTFQILMPSEAIPFVLASAPAVIGQKETPGIEQTTILIVEDEALLRDAVSRMLRRKGLSVIEASDGSFALDVIRKPQFGFNVILLDMTLPGTSSLDVYQEARRLRPDAEVIVTSAKSEEMAAAFLAAGVKHFLRKPYSVIRLIAIIREILTSRRHDQRAANH